MNCNLEAFGITKVVVCIQIFFANDMQAFCIKKFLWKLSNLLSIFLWKSCSEKWKPFGFCKCYDLELFLCI